MDKASQDVLWTDFNALVMGRLPLSTPAKSIKSFGLLVPKPVNVQHFLPLCPDQYIFENHLRSVKITRRLMAFSLGQTDGIFPGSK